MGTTNSFVARAFAACVLASACSVALGDELTDRAKGLLDRQQAKQAYQLLLPQESARAGQPDYDYLLGIAALDAGDAERAVFALERVLAVQPNNHVARAEIARAYLALGERDAARREFQTVREQSIPAEAKANIDRFLAAIRTAETTRVEGYIELGAGYDTNVNAATGSSQIAIPALGGIIATLDPAATKQADSFGQLAGGVNLTHKLNEAWSVVGNAAGAVRLHADETRFDQLILDGTLGARWSGGKEAFTLAGQLQSFELDWARYRETTGAVAQWQHSYDERRQASLFGQYSQLRYPGQSIRDANREVLGMAYGKAFTVTYTPVLFTSAYVGRERELASGVPHLGHELFGARLGGQLRLGSGWSVLGSAAYEERHYGGPEPFFLRTRKDKQLDLSAGVSYLLRANTTVLAQLAHTDNRSNIPINEFDRTVGTVSVRFNF
jgi:tetratricopeptide (TPR) repeat protein